MDKIEVKILNPEVIQDAEQMMVAMARMTQRGHKISTMNDLDALIRQPYTQNLVHTMAELPHPTIQKFGVINVAIVGASRRFLAQITRHQNEVKYMSGSLQYSDYSDKAQFVVPYELIEYEHNNPKSGAINSYLHDCAIDLVEYENLVDKIGHDAAGYKLPQGMRNVLIISATPYQFKHMIRQRTCNRNTLETQYVMGRIWEELYKYSIMFSDCGPFCTTMPCPEGKMCCTEPFSSQLTPSGLLDQRFKLIRR